MCKGKCGWLGMIAFILVIIGGINWGLVGIFNFDLVAAIFGSMSVVARIIYILVGVAAVYKIFAHCCKKSCMCKDGSCNCGPMDAGQKTM